MNVVRYIKQYNLIVKDKQPKYSDEISIMIELMKIHRNYTKVAKLLGISDNAVKKRFIKLGYPDNIKDLINIL
jgi:hypothetical protein